jgi:hypothetical protein
VRGLYVWQHKVALPSRLAGFTPSTAKYLPFHLLTMNKLILAFAITTIAIVAHSAYAGPDVGQTMERDKAAAEHRALEERSNAKALPRIALPLDHGPHAQTTPWANKQRLRQANASDSVSH